MTQACFKVAVRTMVRSHAFESQVARAELCSVHKGFKPAQRALRTKHIILMSSSGCRYVSCCTRAVYICMHNTIMQLQLDFSIHLNQRCTCLQTLHLNSSDGALRILGRYEQVYNACRDRSIDAGRRRPPSRCISRGRAVPAPVSTHPCLRGE